jgi:hypothetical protein
VWPVRLLFQGAQARLQRPPHLIREAHGRDHVASASAGPTKSASIDAHRRLSPIQMVRPATRMIIRGRNIRLPPLCRTIARLTLPAAADDVEDANDRDEQGDAAEKDEHVPHILIHGFTSRA